MKGKCENGGESRRESLFSSFNDSDINEGVIVNELNIIKTSNKPKTFN